MAIQQKMKQTAVSLQLAAPKNVAWTTSHLKQPLDAGTILKLFKPASRAISHAGDQYGPPPGTWPE